jgi:hypothetical protein
MGEEGANQMRNTIEMAREAGIELDLIDEDEGQIYYITTEGMKAFEALVRADEREACAKVADGWPDYDVQGLAEAIRARGETK